MFRNIMHPNRYILVVDGQRKLSFDQADAATNKAEMLKVANPRVAVSVYDQDEARELVLPNTNAGAIAPLSHDPS